MRRFDFTSSPRMFRIAAAAVLTGALGATAGCASMGSGEIGSASGTMSASDAQARLEGWPESSRMAAMDMMQKYGPPQEVTATSMMWRNNGPWKWTRLSRMEVRHDFPMPHPDVLEQAIDYQVPPDLFDDLARYDGSVMVERTKGEMSARCDKEGANFLALNLADDIVRGRRTVDQARQYYAQAMQTFKAANRMDPYMQGLRFQVASGATGDPDRPAMSGMGMSQP